MAEGHEAFADELRKLGITVEETLSGNRVIIEYEPSTGRFRGQHLRLGFEVPPNFPRTPPGGPHVSPALLPINRTAARHPDKVLPSAFGNDWQYWSRPFPNWNGRGGVARYLAFVDKLFDTA